MTLNTILLQRLVEHASEKEGSELAQILESLGIETSDLLTESKKGYKKEASTGRKAKASTANNDDVETTQIREEDDDYVGDEDDDHDEDEEEVDESQLQESLDRLLETLDTAASSDFRRVIEEQGFSAEFLDKTQAIMESAFNARARAVETQLEEKYEAISESYINEHVLPAIDDYLSYVAEEYIRENEEQVVGNARVEIAESLLTGLKDLFEEHNVTVPEAKRDVVEEQESELQRLRSELNEEIQRSKELNESLKEERRKNILQEASRELTVNEAAKLEELAEGLRFESDEKFRSQVKGLKESYFRAGGQDTDVAGTGREEEPQSLEESQSQEGTSSSDPQVSALNEQITKMFGNRRF